MPASTEAVAIERCAQTRSRPAVGAVRIPLSVGAVALATALAGIVSVVGADSRWLGALGGAIVRSGGIPDGVPFAAASSAGWHNAPVLGELVFHGLFAAGLRAVLAAQLLAVAVALTAGAVDARRDGANEGGIALVVLVASAAAFPELAIVRSQLFSLALFPILMLLLRSDARHASPAVWLVVPLLAVWANLHGAVLVGLAMLLAYLAVGRARRSRLEIAGIAAGACIACCATPALWHTPLYYADVLSNEAARRGEGLWAPLSLNRPFDVVLAAGAALLVVLAARGGMRRWEWVCVAVLGVATVHAARNGVWLVLASAPPAARGVPVGSVAATRVAGLAAAIGVAGIVLALGRGPGTTGAGPTVLAEALRSANGTPVLAEDVLAEQVALAGGRIWIGNPLDAFARSDQAAYLDWLAGRRPELMQRADVVLVAVGSRSDRLVAADPAFVRRAADAHAELWVRRP